MKKAMKKWIAFLLCLHTVLFVVFQVSSVVVAETDSFGQYITSEEVQESEEILEETLESEDADESVEGSVEETLESEESEESVESEEETLESEESVDSVESEEETLESEEETEGSEESEEEDLESEETEESEEETLEGEEESEESVEDSEDDDTAEETQESEEVVEETFEYLESSGEVSLIDEEDTEIEDDTSNGATLTWMSYADYRAAEALKAWNDPDLYVGQTAIFNENWGYIFLENEDEAQVTVDDEEAEGLSVPFEDCCDKNGQSIKVVITDYIKASESELWYKIAAAEGYELTETLSENPYVLYTDLGEEEYDPSLIMLPLQGMFVGETVYVQKAKVAASRGDFINVADVPTFFDVVWCTEELDENAAEGTIPLEFYDLGDVSDWAGITGPDYRYVLAESVILIPAEVSRAYNELMNSKDADEYNEIMSKLPEAIISQFTDKHLEYLEEHFKDISEIDPITYTTKVTIGGKEVEVSVHGRIPAEGITLYAAEVASATVLSEGFDVEDATDIVAALDIKLLKTDGSEWQPAAGEVINVSIGMTALGYNEGDIVRVHHKHDDDIYIFEMIVVMDGKVKVGVEGFSLFVISDFKNFNQSSPGSSTGTRVINANTGTVTLKVGDDVVFYTDIGTEDEDNLTSVWWVTDPEGAIYYEIYSDRTPNSYGSNGRWIRVKALKTTVNPISLRFLYTDNIDIDSWVNPDNFNHNNMREQSFSLVIEPPEPTAADTDGYRLYIKDTVNTTGTITAVLVDEEGEEVTTEELGGTLTCSWVRDDNAYIIPNAYRDNGVSIDICRDHGGLLQNRLKNVTYTVTAKLPDGRVKTASYTVFYQSEILNASFENPATKTATYTFLPNGYPNLFWKTTSPGDWGNLARDIEFVRYNETGNTTFESNNTFHPNRPDDGRQIAEINAENFGALYQDIITAPGENLSWEFEHAERDDRDGDSMFIIIGPTEHAQTLTDYTLLQGIVREIVDYYIDTNKNNHKTDAQVLNYLMGSTNGVRNSIIYPKTLDNGKTVVYQAWYNDADALDLDSTAAWTNLAGEYEVPANQYRTRLFFVSNPIRKGGEYNYGNLIDSSRGGQYKDFLIEYYEEQYVTDDEGSTTLVRNLITTIQPDEDEDPIAATESGTAIMYSSVVLQNYSYFELVEHDLLASVYINSANSPYNLKYLDDPCLFIESYPKATVTCLDDKVTNRPASYYAQYDIVMQLCFRDTMIAVQKWVEFPKVGTGTDAPQALTATQKQNLIKELVDENGHGYEANFDLQCNTDKHQFANKTITIAKNDPAGWYTGYVPIGDNPKGSHSFTLQEVYASDLTGLTLDKVQFDYYKFNMGQRLDPITILYEDVQTQEVEVNGVKTNQLVGVLSTDDSNTLRTVSQSGIILADKGDDLQKLAEIKVTNYYKEKEIIINYEVVGRGKVALQDGSLDYVDKASETFAYYSGNPQGVRVQGESGYIFAGWYLDKDCTKPVDKNHGYVENDAFLPNKDRTITDNVLEVTYYAKFSIGSLMIVREKAEPGQVFVYEIKDANNETMYVTLVADQNGEGSVEIIDVPFGGKDGLQYTVKQINSWSWRYEDEPDTISQTHIMVEGLHGSYTMTTAFRFPVEDKGAEPYWLNGNSSVVTNKYGGGAN